MKKQSLRDNEKPLQWVVYILECSDGTLYTGITNQLERRLEVHGKGLGAKYTRARLPLVLRYFEPQKDRSEASRREIYIKQLSRKQKEQLIRGE